VAVFANLVLVGAPGLTTNGDTGIVYAYTKRHEYNDDLFDDGKGEVDDAKIPEGWDLEAVLYADGASAFGSDVAISGSLIVVGAPFGGGRRGAAYVYNRTLVIDESDDDINDNVADPPSYLLLTTLRADVSSSKSREFFGISVAVHAHTIVIGQYLAFDDFYDVQSGSAHVYTTHTSGQQLTVWTHAAVLVEPVAEPVKNYFGRTVAIRDNSVLVGAPGSSTFSNCTVYAFGKFRVDSPLSNLRGSAYTMSSHYTYWSHQATLRPIDRPEMIQKGVTADMFGAALAVTENGVALVGVPETYGSRGYVSGAIHSFQAQVVSDGSADNDDTPPIGDSSNTNTPTQKSHKDLIWLILLVIPACVLAVCMYVQESKKTEKKENKSPHN